MNVTGSLTETDKGMEICVMIVDIKPAVTQLVSWQFKPSLMTQIQILTSDLTEKQKQKFPGCISYRHTYSYRVKYQTLIKL